MDDTSKTRAELLRELAALRRRVAEAEGPSDAGIGRPNQADTLVSDSLAASLGRGLAPGIVANLPLIVWALDREGVFMLSEGKNLETLGLGPGEVVGRSVYDLYRDIPEIGEYTRRAMKGECVTATTDVRGTIFVCWYSPLRSAAGEILGVVGVAMDVTGQKQVEARLLADQQLLERMLSSQERDRRLTAYEIHDGLVQDATGALMHMQAMLCQGRVPAGPLRDELELASSLIRKAVDEARHLISGLRPPVLDSLGVVAAIEYLIDDQPADGPWIDFTDDVSFDRLDPLQEGTIYRVVQEAITNIRRHSKSDRAEIRLTQAGDRIRVEVVDWGVGFDPKNVDSKRLGLQGIRERARLLHGWAEIESTPGKGTRIRVDLPFTGQPTEAVTTRNRSLS